MKKIVLITTIILGLILLSVVIYFKTLPKAESIITKNEDKLEKTKEVIITETGIELADINEIKHPLSMIKTSSELFFTVDGMTGTKGRFDSIQVDFLPATELRESKLNAIIQSKSIYTANKLRDEHLLEEDFFDVKNHPLIKFTTTSIELSDSGYIANGKLSFLGNEKKTKVPFKYKGKGVNDNIEFHVFEGGFTFNRIDFGMKPNSMVGDIVSINFYLEMSAKK